MTRNAVKKPAASDPSLRLDSARAAPRARERRWGERPNMVWSFCPGGLGSRRRRRPGPGSPAEGGGRISLSPLEREEMDGRKARKSEENFFFPLFSFLRVNSSSKKASRPGYRTFGRGGTSRVLPQGTAGDHVIFTRQSARVFIHPGKKLRGRRAARASACH